ncbi:LytR/AlgR family response regulator transcription factor [Sphingobacterium sp. HJSM2_6]|uniref:LytR/AlgR family response regulator transcription factor n=1 Tax=Sphingobacterium sp. HJSM2_6 TaxID=3366264 RepID=UPI003BE30DBE
MIKAIAIDDEPLALEVIKHHAKDISYLHIQQYFTNAFEAIKYLQYHDINLLFLDIHMPDINGIDLFKNLKHKPLLIFTTAYSEYALSGFELDALDYLLKPYSKARFLKACQKAKELLELKGVLGNDAHLYVKDGYQLVKINLNEVYYLEADGNYIRFQMPDKQILARLTIKEFLESCPDQRFIQIHRSYVINSNFIQKIGKTSILIQQEDLPIGVSFQKVILEKLALLINSSPI